MLVKFESMSKLPIDNDGPCFQISSTKLNTCLTLYSFWGRGVVRGGAKGAKAAFQILVKRCVLIAAVEITPSEIIIPSLKSCEFYSVTWMLVVRKAANTRSN